jgi:hypothetical protein
VNLLVPEYVLMPEGNHQQHRTNPTGNEAGRSNPAKS